MLPTIPINSKLVIDESFYQNRSPRRFDIVVARREYRPAPDSEHASMQVVARIVGLPGEVISVRRGRLYVNGRRQREPFLTKPCPLKEDEGFPCREVPPVRIPADQYFLLADNRPESEDSRLWIPKTIPRHNVIGKVVRIIPPPPNKGMHPTANSAALIENLCVARLCARRVMPSVGLLALSNTIGGQSYGLGHS